jgi:hypothetical protein
VLIWVDGGRFYLPVPDVHQIAPNEYEYRVATRPLTIARLIHGLAGWPGSTADEGCKRAGFVLDS